MAISVPHIGGLLVFRQVFSGKNQSVSFSSRARGERRRATRVNDLREFVPSVSRAVPKVDNPMDSSVNTGQRKTLYRRRNGNSFHRAIFVQTDYDRSRIQL